MVGNCGALFGFIEAGAGRGFGGKGRTGKAKQQENEETSENRHRRGDRRAPVNAG
jgi:hypothetical protein